MRWGLYVFPGGQPVSSWHRANEHQHMARVYYQLENIEPGGRFTDPVHFNSVFSAARKREMVIFISDMYEQHGEIQNMLDQLLLFKHEVMVFHLLARNEQELDFKGYTVLEDMETGETVKTDPARIRKAYQEKLEQYLAALRLQLLDKNIFYRLLVTDQLLDQGLRDFLNQRHKSRR